MSNVVTLANNSVLGATKVPIELTVQFEGNYFLKEECGRHFATKELVPVGANFTRLGEFLYPSHEVFQVIRADRGTRQTHISLTPLAVRAEDNRWFESPAAAEANGLECFDGMWAVPVYNDGYHSGRRHAVDIDKAEYHIGVEIEKEDPVMYKKWKAIQLRKIGWAKERDGSLAESSGYELVSPTYDMMSNRMFEDIQKHDMLQELISGKFSSRCGGHINISCRNCDTVQLFKRLAPYVPLLYAMYPTRCGLSTCERRPFQNLLRPHKYSAVYIKPYAVEFRIFPAVRDVACLEGRVNLLRHMVTNDCRSVNDVKAQLAEGTDLAKILTPMGFNPTRLLPLFEREAQNFNHS